MTSIMEPKFVAMSVLYLEENDDIRKIISTNLEKIVQKLIIVKNADEALEYFKLYKPDVLISTICDTAGDWGKLLRHIKRSKPETFIIATARLYSESVILKALDIGINKFFVKPTIEKLKNALVEFDEIVSLKRYAEEYENFLFQYKQAIDVAALVVHLDAKMNITYVNQGFCSIFGYYEQELLGKNITYYLNLSRHELLHIRRELRKNKIYKGIIEFKSKSKKNFVIESTIFPMLNSLGKTVELISISHDVTQIREDVWANLRSVFDSDSSPIVVIDESFKIIVLNKSMLSLLNFSSKEEFLKSGKCVCDYFVNKEGYLNCSLFDDERRGGMFDEFIVYLASSAIKKEQNKVMIKHQLRGDVRVFTVHLSSVLNRFFGDHIYNILTFVDITELERLKEEQINNIKLTSIGKLAAGVTHEINTPLTYMKGNFEMLRAEFESECKCGAKELSQDLFENISDGLRRVENIVESMKEIAGGMRREKTISNLYSTLIYSMRMICHKAKQISQMYINGKLFALEADKDEEEFHMLIEPQRLEQVWIIILNNALDEFHNNKLPYEERRVDVLIQKFDGEVVVKIKDNAGGIPDQMLGAIFDMFTSTKQHSGMGVGLNIARTIIEDHNGSIKAYNRDAGAVFEICFNTKIAEIKGT